MRFYGIKRKRIEEKSRYFIAKTKFLCASNITFDKQKRDRQKSDYNSIFAKNYRLGNRDLSIPEGKYYTPVCILTSDLILRENIPELQKGLIRLLRRQYSHKFFGGHHSTDEISGRIEKMDDTLTSWYEDQRWQI